MQCLGANSSRLFIGIHAPTTSFILNRDIKHSKCIVAGDRNDGNVYHQVPNNRSNAKWRMVAFADEYGSKTYYLMDKKHNHALVAGNVANNHVYHQLPDSRQNARWAIVPNYLR